jgi:hypothetical protein
MINVGRILAIMALALVMTCCTAPGGSPPVITASFAAKEVSHGDVWKIYLEANDPDGDMWEIAYTLSRSGTGDYRVNHVNIRKRDRAKILGYLYVFFTQPQTGLAEWASGTLTLHIRDRGGNSSDKVTFPVALTRGVKQPSPPSPFNTGGLKSLGQIWIKLYVPRGE